MCNFYYATRTYEALAAAYQAVAVGTLATDGPVVPKSLAPGLIATVDGQRELHPMQFAFSPPGWPTKTDPKRLLNNARIESLGKWPWVEAAKTSRCVLPMTEFREPCYWGEPAGTEVLFRRNDNDLMHVAGIYRLWKSPDGTESLLTMSLVMRPASPFVMDHGHHRQPFFLEESGIDAWISPAPLTTAESLSTLRRYAAEPDLTYKHSRNMAESWKSRQKSKLKARDEQLEAIEKSGALG